MTDASLPTVAASFKTGKPSGSGTSISSSSTDNMSIEALRRAIAANPDDPFAWYALGARCYAQKLPKEALQCFEKAETIKRGFSAANYYYTALALRQLGRSGECSEYLKKAVAMKAINAVDKKARALSAKVLSSLEKSGAAAKV